MNKPFILELPSWGYHVNVVDVISKNSELSKTEVRRRMKAGAVKWYEADEVLDIPDLVVQTIDPITLKYGKKDWLQVVFK